MKTDFRKQTFSKPGKPSDEEIKRLTSSEDAIPSPLQASEENQSDSEKSEHLSLIKNGAKSETKISRQIVPANNEKLNPFLLSRGQTSEISIEKTGYRLRSDYMDLLKLVKRMKKGHTLEAVLDDALTFYFENSEDGCKAAKQREMLDAE
jgi:hypothetical protein